MTGKKYLSDKPCKRGHFERYRYRNACVECAKIQYREWKEKNPDYHKDWFQKNKHRKREKQRSWRAANPNYSKEYYRRNDNARVRSVQWKKDQQEKLAGRPRPSSCELCGRTGRIVWDHNHDTGKFRGWLCYPCNSILGLVKDDPEVLRKMADYLERSNDMAFFVPAGNPRHDGGQDRR